MKLKYFKGVIAEKSLVDFRKYDNSIDTLKARTEHVNGLVLEEGLVHEFFTTYFEKYYDVSPNQNGYLAEEDAVCKLLEGLGTYLVSSKDIPSERKVEYRFWKDERDFKKSKESENINTSSMSASGSDSNVEIIDMFVDKKNDKNQKIVKDISVNKKDIKDIEELAFLQDAIEFFKSPKGIKHVRNHVSTILSGEGVMDDDKGILTYIMKNTEDYLNSYAKTLRDNQVLIKKAIKRPIEFKNVLKDEGVPNKLDVIDFMEEKDVKELLPFLSQSDLMSDIGIIIFDLQKLLETTKLSPREAEVVDMYKEGLKQTDIAQELDVNTATIRKMERRIALKASKTYENQVKSYRDEIRKKKN